MRNELDQSTKLVVCPADERQAALGFSNQFGNLNVSYFVGVSADELHPQSIAGGDRNLGYGPEAYREFGYSPSGGKGNDVAVETDSGLLPVSWSQRMHTANWPSAHGNILLGDGSAQMTSTATFRKAWLSQANPTTNWPTGHVPSSPSIRLVFP